MWGVLVRDDYQLWRIGTRLQAGEADCGDVGGIQSEIDRTIARHQRGNIHGGPNTRAERTRRANRIAYRGGIAIRDAGFSPRVVRNVPDAITSARSAIGKDAQGHTHDRAGNSLNIEAQVAPHDR